MPITHPEIGTATKLEIRFKNDGTITYVPPSAVNLGATDGVVFCLLDDVGNPLPTADAQGYVIPDTTYLNPTPNTALSSPGPAYPLQNGMARLEPAFTKLATPSGAGTQVHVIVVYSGLAGIQIAQSVVIIDW